MLVGKPFVVPSNFTDDTMLTNTVGAFVFVIGQAAMEGLIELV